MECDAMLKMSSLPEVAVVEVEVAGKGRGVLGGGALKKQETPENYLHHAERMGNWFIRWVWVVYEWRG
jgi:hypothetical protein